MGVPKRGWSPEAGEYVIDIISEGANIITMNKLAQNLLTTTELAAETSRSDKRIRQLAPALAKMGLAIKKQNGWLFDAGAIEFVTSQPKPGPRKRGS
jgi:hypothetical protein